MTCTPVGLTGDACASDDDCSASYSCDAATSTCKLGPRLGEVLTGCIDRSFCDGTTMTCTTPKADGQPCGLDSQCESRSCDPVTNTCITPPICI